MQRGAFLVADDPEHPQEIAFLLAPDFPGPIPEEQLQLQEQVSRTLSIVTMLFEHRKERLAEVKSALLGISRVGLVGDVAQPALALRALATLRADVLDREAGRVKNQYMRVLGWWALGFVAIGCVACVLLARTGIATRPFIGLLQLSTASAAGVWFSFGARKTELRFEELHVIEADRVGPGLRIVFTAGLTVVFGLMIMNGWIDITIGAFEASSFALNTAAAALLGALSGIGEQVLSPRVVREVETLFGHAAWTRP